MSHKADNKIKNAKLQKRANEKPFEKVKSDTIVIKDSKGNTLKTIKDGKYVE